MLYYNREVAMKKIVSLLLIVWMLTSLVTVAFAEEENRHDVLAEYKKVSTSLESEINLEIQWGKMEFTYTVNETKLWNPDKHAYDVISSEAQWSAVGNTVKVINHSDASVVASFSYNAAEAYTAVSGSFSSASVVLPSAQNTSLEEAPTEEVTLTLSGELPETAVGMQKVGEVTVALAKLALPDKVGADSVETSDPGLNVYLGGYTDKTPVQTVNENNYFVFSVSVDTFHSDLTDEFFACEVYFRLEGDNGGYYSVKLNQLYFERDLFRYNFYCDFADTGMQRAWEVGNTYEFVIEVYMNGESIGYGVNTMTWTADWADVLA